MTIMPHFTYHRPESLEHAMALLGEHGTNARVLAGGTDLVVKLRAGRIIAEHVVSLTYVPGLDQLSFDPDTGLTIGAGARISEVGRFPAVVARYPGLSHACSVMATNQIRNMGTVVGNLVNGSPCADTAGPLLTHEAVLEVASVNGRRRIPLDELFVGPGKVALDTGEIVVAVHVPAPPARFGAHYIRLSARSRVDMSAVSVAGAVVLHDDVHDGGRVRVARLALGAVAPTPMRCRDAEAMLADQRVDDDLIGQVADACAAAAKPVSDVRASAAYRREMVRVLTARVLRAALNAAQGQGKP